MKISAKQIQAAEKKLFPRWILREGNSTKEYFMYDKCVKKGVGGEVTVDAAAPGVGHTTYKITKITDTWVYGYVAEDTTDLPDIDFYI